MSRLHTRVNPIPVIAKADTMTGGGIADFKIRVCLPHVSFVGKRAEILMGSHRYPLPPYPDLPGPHIRERGWGVPVPVTPFAHLTKPRPMAVQALRDVSRFAPHPSPRKQAYRTAGIITKTEVGRISYIDRVYPDQVGTTREKRVY